MPGPEPLGNQGLDGLWRWFLVVIGLGFVVFIHELGHFLAAKWCGVHVQTFSIGFGPALPGCSYQYGETLYWSEQRTTPRAYITLAKGKELWTSRFGDLTSIRLAPKDGGDVEAAAERFRVALLKRLIELGWLVRQRDSRAVSVTEAGRRGLREAFGVDLDEVRPKPVLAKWRRQ